MRPYSLSKIQCFEQCSMQYKFRYIDKVKCTQNTALTKGSKIHSLLENYNTETIDNAENSSEREIVKKFFNSNVYNKYIKIFKEHTSELAIGLKVFDNNLIPCNYNDKEALFRGKIDVLKNNFIFDYKTGKSKTYENQNWTQLTWYAIWLFLNSDYDKVVIGYFYVEHNQANLKILERKDLNDMIKEMLVRIKEADSFDGVAKYHNTPLCNWCGYYDICQKQQALEIENAFKIC